MEGRRLVQSTLDEMRDLLFHRKLALFIGEEISSLRSEAELDWWRFVGNDAKSARQFLECLEEKFLKSLQPPGESHIHNTLRTVGDWPIIFTTNMDRLIERLVWRGEDIERLRLDQITSLDFDDWLQYPESRKLLIKTFGDTGVVTRLDLKLRSVLEDIPVDILKSLKKIFDCHSVLFLGVDLKKYEPFFNAVVFTSKLKHYMLRQGAETTVEPQGSLHILSADLELWEFSRYLTSGKIDEVIIPGKVYERSYLASQREEYLLQQLHIEEKAAEILFHTLQITNALATDDLLEKQSRPKLVDIYRSDPLGVYSEENVERAYKAMLARRNNLVKLINGGLVPVKAVFFYEEFLKEITEKSGESASIRAQRQMALMKYAECILLAKSVLKPNSTLELLVVEGLSPEEMLAMQKETFALIKLAERRDEAVCYAETAVPGRKLLQTHYISINGPEVISKRRVYEGSVARAWSNKDSILKLTAKIVEVNQELNALSVTILEKLQSLNSVVAMLDRSIDATSLVHLGGGSFGDVYRAVWNNIPVALKFLKEAVHPDDLFKFQQEFDSLLRAKHDNIVRVYKMTVENNRLGLIMEYVDGYNLRELLIKKGQQLPDVVMRCAKQLASAISHLHVLKIVHRDVKTDNILVTKDLQLFKLADFGLARVVERTEQYKTVKGTYRYMAPEILKRSKVGGAKYSLTVDVYSYGLVILETITGKPVFQNLTREELEMGKRDGTLRPIIPEWCLSVHGPVIAEVVKRSVADAERRPSMERIHQILINNDLSEMDAEQRLPLSSTLEILCLGTGKGATTLLTGEPSSSFVIMHDGKPLLVVDLGFGVVHSYRKCLGNDAPFSRIYITHNHSDHAAELPVLLAVVGGKPTSPQVYAAPEVMHRLHTQRLVEIASQANLNEICELKTCETGSCRTPLSSADRFSIAVLPSQHSETCYGFILYEDNVPLLGYTGDSGFDRSLYDQLFVAPNVVIDARTCSTYEHAGFSDVINYLADKQILQNQIFVTGYGTESEYPPDGIPNITQLKVGERYSLLSTSSKVRSGLEWTKPIRTNLTAEYLVPAKKP